MKSLTETETHYDESRVPDYVLPDPLRFADGRAVTAAMWPQRRQELLTLFQQHIYGTPADWWHYLAFADRVWER